MVKSKFAKFMYCCWPEVELCFHQEIWYQFYNREGYNTVKNLIEGYNELEKSWDMNSIFIMIKLKYQIKDICHTLARSFLEKREFYTKITNQYLYGVHGSTYIEGKKQYGRCRHV